MCTNVGWFKGLTWSNFLGNFSICCCINMHITTSALQFPTWLSETMRCSIAGAIPILISFFRIFGSLELHSELPWIDELMILAEYPSGSSVLPHLLQRECRPNPRRIRKSPGVNAHDRPSENDSSRSWSQATPGTRSFATLVSSWLLLSPGMF